MMRLVQYSDEDLALTEALESDPAVMGQLGGPVSSDGIMDIHRQRLAGIVTGDRYYAILLNGGEAPVGIAGMWDSSWNGTTIREVGVMLSPVFQGRGIAPQVLRALFQVARAEDCVSELHAFVAVTNRAGNAVFERLGFRSLGEHDLDYADRPLRCLHWAIRLDQPS